MANKPSKISKETDQQLSDLYSELAQCGKTITDWHDRAGRVTNQMIESPEQQESLATTADPEQTKLAIKHSTHGDFVTQAEEALAKAVKTVREIKRVRYQNNVKP